MSEKQRERNGQKGGTSRRQWGSLPVTWHMHCIHTDGRTDRRIWSVYLPRSLTLTATDDKRWQEERNQHRRTADIRKGEETETSRRTRDTDTETSPSLLPESHDSWIMKRTWPSAIQNKSIKSAIQRYYIIWF